jgi:hypothetical protein
MRSRFFSVKLGWVLKINFSTLLSSLECLHKNLLKAYFRKFLCYKLEVFPIRIINIFLWTDESGKKTPDEVVKRHGVGHGNNPDLVRSFLLIEK